MGGGPPFTPKIVIPGWTAGGVRALWVSGDPPRCTHIFLSNNIFNWKEEDYVNKYFLGLK